MAAVNKLRPMLTAIRCAIYTRKSTDEDSTPTSIHWTPSANRLRRSSSAKGTRAGCVAPEV